MDFDFDCAAASPGGQWVGETASRRRQRRLSSSSLRTYLTPAFDAVAASQGGISPSSYSSGGLELGFDASLLRLRRTCFSASAELDSRRLLYSPQSPPQQQTRPRPMYTVAEHEAAILAAEAYRYGSKRQAGGLTGAPGFPELKPTFPNPSRPPPVGLLSPDGTFILGNGVELLSTTPKPGATTSAQATSAAQPQPTVDEEDRIAEALYGRSGRRRLPIFMEICPE